MRACLQFRVQLCVVMLLDFGGAYVVEFLAKALFLDVRPRPMVTKGSERREARRAIEEAERQAIETKAREEAEKQLIEDAEARLEAEAETRKDR